MNNQTFKADANKPQLILVPTQIIKDIAEIREYGIKKYGAREKESWKLVEPERYDNALFRHLLAYLESPNGVDKESGFRHYMHMACNLAFICELRQGAEPAKKPRRR